MNNTKLISVLISLSMEEWSSFRKYLLMHTGKASDNFVFFDFLSQRKKKLDTLDSAEEIREKHFNKLTSKGFSNMMSRIYHWLEEWLALHEFRQDPYKEDLMLIKTYNKRGLFKLANAKASKLEKQVLKQQGLDISTNKVLAELFHIQCYSENAIKYSEGGLLLEKLTKHFFMQMKEFSLLYLPELVNVQRIQKYDLSKSIDQINQLVKVMPHNELGIHLTQLTKLIQTNDKDLFEDLFRKVKQGVFAKDGFIHTLIVYYLIALSLQLWLKGVPLSKDLIGEIHDYGIESGVLLTNKKIARRRFHNIVSTMAAIKSYDWTMEFVEKYYQLVDTPNVESSKKLAFAQVCMYHDRYHEIEGYVSSVSFDDFDIKMRSHGLQAVALYKDEAIDLDILQNKLSNFKRFLSRHKSRVSEKYYESYYNFFDVLVQLSMMKFKNKKVDLSKFSNLTYRFWIKNELALMEKEK